MIIVGKDVLELLSSAMYVDPLTIYREYVQNAADAIDDARAAGVLAREAPGKVDITIDSGKRLIGIRDNGAGIPIAQATGRLLAIGASTKRGTRARGFRGVGRLAGLAYGRNLTFRTRAAGDKGVLELRWDCQRLKAALRDVRLSDDIGSVIQRVVTISHLDGDGWPTSFFEVELSDVIRTKRDALLSPSIVADYLSQIAPVPFDATFSWGREIEAHLAPVRLGNLEIRLEPNGVPLARPITDAFKVSDTLTDTLGELELLTLTDLDGGVAGLGWLLHHSYLGSITVRSQIGGIRARVGNVQVGSENLLEEIFPETRFNSWAVGEVHVLDPRILPNARRDNFEQNVHYSNLTAQLEPLARQIARRARAASIARNNVRRAELAAAALADAAGHRVTKGTNRDYPSTSEFRVDDAPTVSFASERAADATAQISEEAKLSLPQKQLVRRLRSVALQSGLSKDELKDVYAHLRDVS
ncbi:hypothetical protein X728_12750 [Mesorhizobium sp. L103C120A0]|nr:hypothetical protein X728_12750 [Mesorhizobium sp. L103C120A0]